MSVAIPAVISFAIVLGAVFTSVGALLRTNADQAEASRASFSGAAGAASTDIRVLSADEVYFGAYSEISVVVANRGKLSYGAFGEWDIVVRYVEDTGVYKAKRLPYSATAADNTWRVSQIYLDYDAGTPEKMDPGVLNPLEEAVFLLRIAPGVAVDSTGEVVITPPEGLTAGTFFIVPPVQSVTLGVVEGWDQEEGDYLSSLGTLSRVQASDNQRIRTSPNFFTSFQFATVSSTGHPLSVVLIFEHFQDQGLPIGSVQWKVGTGSLSNPSVLSTTTAPTRSPASQEGDDSWDVSSVINSATLLNNMKAVIAVNDLPVVGKKNNLDYLRAVVTYRD